MVSRKLFWKPRRAGVLNAHTGAKTARIVGLTVKLHVEDGRTFH